MSTAPVVSSSLALDPRTAPPTGARVLIAMSGGVDSSAAAAMLVRAGYDVVGVTMKLHEDGQDRPDRPCCSLDSTNDARRVAQQIGIPHYVVNLVESFTRDVRDHFIAEYAAGRTPIPCTRCNTYTKFRDLVRIADQIDAPYIATGHYVRLQDGRIYRATDHQKDQSYFLWGLRPEVLARLLFPVGEQTKAVTRALAADAGLHLAQKRESQDICFVPDGDHVAVVRAALAPDSAALQPGSIVDEHGTVVGTHQGLIGYTVGQRKGLPGGGTSPRYVTRLDLATRTVHIGPREALVVTRLIAHEPNWLEAPPRVGDEVEVRVRHRAPLVRATVESVSATELAVALEQPVEGVSPGQSLVCYHLDGALWGGGTLTAGPDRGRDRPKRALPVL